MCTNKLIIKPSELSSGFRPLYLPAIPARREVPCGKCYECLSQKRSDLEFRMMMEYKYCREVQKGCAYVIMLTYDSSCIPVYDYASPETGEIKKVYGFNHRDVQLFLKRLRLWLDELHGNRGYYFKYFVVSEYGDEKKRPHYHIVFFGDALLHSKWFSFACEVKNRWHCGFVGKIDYDNFVVRSDNALSYVCKYVTKTDDYCDYLRKTLGLQKFYTDRDLLLYLKSDPDLKKFTPYQRWSKNFGIYALDFLSDEDFIKGTKVLPQGKDLYPKSYNIPMYLKRKILYDYDKETKLFTLNQKGFDILYKQNEDISARLASFADMLNASFNLDIKQADFQYFVDSCKLRYRYNAPCIYDSKTKKPHEILQGILRKKSLVALYNIYTYRFYNITPLVMDGRTYNYIPSIDALDFGRYFIDKRRHYLNRIYTHEDLEKDLPIHQSFQNTIYHKYFDVCLILDFYMSKFLKKREMKSQLKYEQDRLAHKLKKNLQT